MTGRERLDRYLATLRRRLRTHIYLQGFAAGAALALAITAATVWQLQRVHFAASAAWVGRALLVSALFAIIALLVWRPLRRLRRDDGAQVLEARAPEQAGRLQTYLDAQRNTDAPSPLIDLLAEDAATIAQHHPPNEVVSTPRIAGAFGVSAAAALALTWLLTLAPAPWDFGSRHVLFGAALPRDAVPVRKVMVEPGDATVRRNSDLAIRAVVAGFNPKQAQLFVRFEEGAQAAAWERAPMRAADENARFEFKLYAVRAPLAYYVEADGVRSAEHRVGVVDLPKIERVRLTYQYPEWTGLQPAVDEEVRDIRAVAGTQVKVEVFADAPLEAPALIVDGAARSLSKENNANVAAVDVEKPGWYQIGARVADEFVALSDEYAIEIAPDEKPVIEIRKPGRDWRATNIEEVPVRIEAQDDYRLRDVQLRYSVNGGDWRAMSLGGGAKERNAESMLRLEELGPARVEEGLLAPGDLVSYYAVAKDRNHTAQTDLFMVQVQPFERRFTQAQAGGAGGGMADDQGAISERQREILLATWNLQRNDERQARTRAQLEDSAQMLAELQATLAQQTRTLAERTRARASLDDERIRAFVESLERAATVMDPAAKHLRDFRLAQAVPVEQQALQQLLHAEAAFRDVQVSMQNSQGAAGAQTARNFTEMFELEMDLEKNQYESESQLSMQNSKQELDEAIRKLKELAERQEKLAEQARRDPQQMKEQRWKQEQLRREAEDLQRRLAEMNRQQQQQQQGPQSASPSEGGAGGALSEQRGERSDDPQREQLEQALASVNRALEDMRAANARAAGEQEDASEAARQASQNLQRALRNIDRPQTSGLDETLERAAEQAREVSQDQRRIESELYQALAQGGGQSGSDAFGSRTALDRRKAQELVQSKQQLAEDLTELQRDLRRAVHEHRRGQPQTTQRVGEILRELESSEVMHRVNRSAAEIYYGRAREAALREGLISEALENLERDLREAAALAAREEQTEGAPSTSEALLARIAQLRRALQESREQGAQRVAPPHPNPLPEGEGVSSSPLPSGEVARSAGEGAPAGEGTLWDDRADSLARETGAISQRVHDLVNRMSRGELTQAEFDALRGQARELRRLAGDPMAERTALLSLIDQMELTALSAAPQSKDEAAARAAPSPDSPRYRDNVAEYYRRLGDK